MGVRPDFIGILLAILGPRIEPEEPVRAITHLGLISQQIVRRHQLLLRHFELAGRVAVKRRPEAGLELRNGALTLLPCGRAAEENAVPVVRSERLAVVVPYRVQLPRGAHLLIPGATHVSKPADLK